ncbi:MAG TPA: hypothetical protein VMW83_10850 [Spirochaetia bacterium]|nr:hypothetical protein [Spirochaetia bacterium]
MSEERYPISLWVNEDRLEKLQNVGLAGMAKEVLAGLKVLEVPCNDAQKDKVLQVFPMAKFDSATTRSIELLPKDVKDKIFDLVVKEQSLDVMDKFLAAY